MLHSFQLFAANNYPVTRDARTFTYTFIAVFRVETLNWIIYVDETERENLLIYIHSGSTQKTYGKEIWKYRVHKVRHIKFRHIHV